MPAHASAQPDRVTQVHGRRPCRVGLGAGGEWWGYLAASRVGMGFTLDGGYSPSTQRPTARGERAVRRCVLSRTQRPAQRDKGWRGVGGGCSGHATRRPAFATGSRRSAVTSRIACRDRMRRRPTVMTGTPTRWPSRRMHSAACERLTPSARAASAIVIVRRSVVMLRPRWRPWMLGQATPGARGAAARPRQRPSGSCSGQRQRARPPPQRPLGGRRRCRCVVCA